MTNNKYLTVDEAEDVLWGDEYENVYDEIVDKRRWETTRFGVYQHKKTGTYWGLYTNEDNTECQECDRFDVHVDGLVELTQYEPYEKTVIAYREI
jgi:hypothetical protein